MNLIKTKPPTPIKIQPNQEVKNTTIQFPKLKPLCGTTSLCSHRTFPDVIKTSNFQSDSSHLCKTHFKFPIPLAVFREVEFKEFCKFRISSPFSVGYSFGAWDIRGKYKSVVQ
ncbi:uncharacterized protein LOC111288195 isoform X2 [Durio zibethinus]|uniref:Uncharacterized protein LOC111288195 isoform X2 n=1 Tax=Durio zibethinus TaxID=66656 RepID=A0A6P5Y2N0_DURZI|nr:uncharacterized protein LOC111288195 isoform X2 [Durio zibethinus]